MCIFKVCTVCTNRMLLYKVYQTTWSDHGTIDRQTRHQNIISSRFFFYSTCFMYNYSSYFTITHSMSTTHRTVNGTIRRYPFRCQRYGNVFHSITLCVIDNTVECQNGLDNIIFQRGVANSIIALKLTHFLIFINYCIIIFKHIWYIFSSNFALFF